MSKKISQLAILVGIIIGVLLVTVIILAFLTGRIYIGFKSSEEKIVITPNVCKEELINKYNESLRQVDSEKSSEMLKAIVDDIRGLDQKDSDPNCLHMELYYVLQNGSQSEIKDIAIKLDSLSNSGKTSSSRLYNVYSVDFIKSLTDDSDASAGSSDTTLEHDGVRG